MATSVLSLDDLREGHTVIHQIVPSMNNVREYHNEAIRQAQLAMMALHQGDQAEHKQRIQCALVAETNAANLVPDEKSSEPTRSILYRSAASFAYQAGEYQEAERLAFKGLSGYPPIQIKQQLLEVQEMIQEAWTRLRATSSTKQSFIQPMVTAIYENGAFTQRLRFICKSRSE